MPDLRSDIERDAFRVSALKIGLVYDNFERELAAHVQLRRAAGLSDAQIEAELTRAYEAKSGIFGTLIGRAQKEVDTALNLEFQISSNKAQPVSSQVLWTLNPQAEHCDSCLFQASQGPRDIANVPVPGLQPQHGETNCQEYCRCTLVPVE